MSDESEISEVEGDYGIEKVAKSYDHLLDPATTSQVSAMSSFTPNSSNYFGI